MHKAQQIFPYKGVKIDLKWLAKEPIGDEIVFCKICY